jgi:hypothetical protein
MSVQVQLRRDTLANVLANHGAPGEVYISTDSKELFIQDGATNGGFKASGVRALFGSLAQPTLAESSGAGGETLTTGVTTYTTALQLPAGYKFIMGAGWLVKTTIMGITTIDFGVTGSPTLFAAAQSPSLTAGSTVIYGQNQVRFDAAPVSLLLTSHVGTNFTAGAIRFVVHYILLSPPTS